MRGLGKLMIWRLVLALSLLANGLLVLALARAPTAPPVVCAPCAALPAVAQSPSAGEARTPPSAAATASKAATTSEAAATQAAAAEPTRREAATAEPRPRAPTRVERITARGAVIDGADARFDAARLRALGLDESEVVRLAELAERMRAESERARDDLAKEMIPAGKRWSGSREQKELAARLWSQLRRDFGDETYDQLRYATRQTNRAVVQGVEQSSSAAAAGFRAGDVIRFYDRAPVFGTEELVRAVEGNRRSGTVLVEVERDGLPLELYVPPGRMGISVQGASLPPPQR